MNLSFRKVYRKLYSLVVGRLKPIKYAQKIGVNFTPPYIFMDQLVGVRSLG